LRNEVIALTTPARSSHPESCHRNSVGAALSDRDRDPDFFGRMTFESDIVVLLEAYTNDISSLFFRRSYLTEELR
jgi:hypothetical protein